MVELSVVYHLINNFGELFYVSQIIDMFLKQCQITVADFKIFGDKGVYETQLRSRSVDVNFYNL